VIKIDLKTFLWL